MAFFLSTKGQIHPYHFKYLKGDFEKARLERTEIHNHHKFPESLRPEQTDFFAIDIMAKPALSLSPTSSLFDVRKLMSEKNIRHIPILFQNKILGMISDRDLLKVDLSGTFPFMKAEDIMSTVLIVALDETPLAHVARVLMEEKISGLPIIDKNNFLVGMISRTDILRAVVYNRLVIK